MHTQRASNALLRRHDIDWLRVLAMLLIFLFHCARFFDGEDWHVKNNQLSAAASLFVVFLSQWIMPLFFLLSAFSSFYALKRRTNGQYISERFQRLVIPLLFGIVFLIPPQVYIERVSHQHYSGPFLQWLPHYLDGMYGFGGNFAWMGLHLWYLEMLFLFSLLVLPLFRWLRSEAARAVSSRLARVLQPQGALLVLAAPIILMEILVNLQPDGIGMRAFGGWSPLTYLVFFILGYLLAVDEAFRLQIQAQRATSLMVAIGVFVAGYFLVTSGYSDRGWAFSVLRGLNSWAWLLAILGFASAHLPFSNHFLSYANRAVLPFYILHQTVIVIIAFFLIEWNASVGAKYLLLSTTAFVTIMLLYELFIRRIKVLQFLFGMK